MTNSTKKSDRDARPPTRRGFLAILGAGAAVIAVGLPPDHERPRSPWTGPNGKLRWIGHY
ncbi:MAG: twin-arginine translocation signal domain-containing protein [Kofleriaceae bacterium]